MAKRDITGAVDFPYLENYAAGDADVIDEVLGIFEHQSELWIRLFDTHAEDSIWRDAAHTLKGASLGIGARTLAAACATAEQGAHEPAPVRAALLDDVRRALDLVRLDIAAYRHHQSLKSLK